MTATFFQNAFDGGNGKGNFKTCVEEMPLGTQSVQLCVALLVAMHARDAVESQAWRQQT